MKSSIRAGSSAVEQRLYTALSVSATSENHTAILRRARRVYKDAPTGERFGRWVVLGEAPRSGAHQRWIVRCDCGREHARQAASLRDGRSTQCSTCGGQAAAAIRALPVSTRAPGGGTRRKRREYSTYCSMLARCYDPETKWYGRYGGRGIAVCDRWRSSFAAFFADMGEAPAGYSIDRIDNDGDYAPGNCRWATATEQARNTRRNHTIEIDGRALCIAAWAAEFGIRPQIISTRLRRGWSERDAVLGKSHGD